MNRLSDNQSEAIELLSKYKVGALFMQPGTGKTRAAIELIKSTPTNAVVWFTPFQTKQNLSDEIEKWGGLDRPFIIVGIESISSSDRIYLQVMNYINQHNTMLILDESLKIKNSDAIRSYRLIELSKLCEYKLILNGTPVSRNLLDLWSQMQFLSPKILNMDIAEFKNTFCEYVKITKKIGYHTYKREFIKQYHNIDYLYSLIKHYVYESDLKLMIQSQHITLNYKLDVDEMSEYNMLKEKYLDNEKLQAMNNNIFLEMTQKMQHIYCLSLEKFNLLDDILSSQDQKKVIVFTKYVDSYKSIKEKYPNLTVLSYQKHSYGLNLQQFNVTIFWEKIWDYALIEQAQRRTYRTGQVDNCIYYHLTSNTGLDSLIDKNISRKLSMVEYFKSKTISQIKVEL